MLTHKPIPKFSKDRQPHTSIKQTGLHHCNARWCEWFYDGRTAERAMLPYQAKDTLNLVAVKTRLAGDAMIPGHILPQTQLWLEHGLRATKEGKL